MRKRNLWEKKETGRNIAIERGRQEESMEMEGKEVKAEMAEKEKKKKRMIGMENRGYGRMGMKNGEWKKMLSLALAGTMAVSLIACGSGMNEADAGEGVPAHLADMTDEGPVHHVIEHHRQLGHREGDGQRQDVLGDAALGKVVSPRSHRLSLSSVFPDLILHLIVGYFFKKCKPFPGEKLSGPAGGPPAQPVRQTFP